MPTTRKMVESIGRRSISLGAEPPTLPDRTGGGAISEDCRTPDPSGFARVVAAPVTRDTGCDSGIVRNLRTDG